MTDVLIPVSHLDHAKTRLEELLDPERRQHLVAACLETAITAVLEAGFSPHVLTGDSRVEALARGRAAVLRESEAVDNLNAAIAESLPHFPATAPLLILHADIPFVSGASLQGLVRNAADPPSAVIAPSANGGTNALYLRPRGNFAPAYGHGSADRHSAALSAAGVSVRYLADPALAFDLDLPGDIWQLDRAAGSGENPVVRLVRSFRLTAPGDRR